MGVPMSPPPRPPLQTLATGGALQPHEVTEDTPPDMLEGQMDLMVELPSGRTVKMTVDRRTPMMDLLVQATTANKISPGGHVVQIYDDKRREFVSYQPSTPIGALDTQTVYIVPKNKINSHGGQLKANNNNINGNSRPFEKTFRLTVRLPKNQLAVLRTSPKTQLGEVFENICREKNLVISRYELRHPDNLDERLRLSCTLSDYRLQEVAVVASDRPASASVSATDIIAMQNKEEKRKSKGLFGFHFKKSKSSLGDSSVSSGSYGDRSSGGGVSPTRSVSPQLQPPTANQSLPPTKNKKRKAPRPPGPTTIEEKPTETLVPNGRPSRRSSSSGSSGYHEPSVLSDGQQDSVKAPRDSTDSQQIPKVSTTNLTNINSNSVMSISSAIRKRRAPPPPVVKKITEVAEDKATSVPSTDEFVEHETELATSEESVPNVSESVQVVVADDVFTEDSSKITHPHPPPPLTSAAKLSSSSSSSLEDSAAPETPPFSESSSPSPPVASSTPVLPSPPDGSSSVGTGSLNKDSSPVVSTISSRTDSSSLSSPPPDHLTTSHKTGDDNESNVSLTSEEADTKKTEDKTEPRNHTPVETEESETVPELEAQEALPEDDGKPLKEHSSSSEDSSSETEDMKPKVSDAVVEEVVVAVDFGPECVSSDFSDSGPQSVTTVVEQEVKTRQEVKTPLQSFATSKEALHWDFQLPDPPSQFKDEEEGEENEWIVIDDVNIKDKLEGGNNVTESTPEVPEQFRDSRSNSISSSSSEDVDEDVEDKMNVVTPEETKVAEEDLVSATEEKSPDLAAENMAVFSERFSQLTQTDVGDVEPSWRSSSLSVEEPRPYSSPTSPVNDPFVQRYDLRMLNNFSISTYRSRQEVETYDKKLVKSESFSYKGQPRNERPIQKADSFTQVRTNSVTKRLSSQEPLPEGTEVTSQRSFAHPHVYTQTSKPWIVKKTMEHKLQGEQPALPSRFRSRAKLPVVTSDKRSSSMHNLVLEQNTESETEEPRSDHDVSSSPLRKTQSERNISVDSGIHVEEEQLHGKYQKLQQQFVQWQQQLLENQAVLQTKVAPQVGVVKPPPFSSKMIKDLHPAISQSSENIRVTSPVNVPSSPTPSDEYTAKTRSLPRTQVGEVDSQVEKSSPWDRQNRMPLRPPRVNLGSWIERPADEIEFRNEPVETGSRAVKSYSTTDLYRNSKVPPVLHGPRPFGTKSNSSSVLLAKQRFLSNEPKVELTKTTNSDNFRPPPAVERSLSNSSSDASQYEGIVSQKKQELFGNSARPQKTSKTMILNDPQRSTHSRENLTEKSEVKSGSVTKVNITTAGKVTKNDGHRETFHVSRKSDDSPVVHGNILKPIPISGIPKPVSVSVSSNKNVSSSVKDMRHVRRSDAQGRVGGKFKSVVQLVNESEENLDEREARQKPKLTKEEAVLFHDKRSRKVIHHPIHAPIVRGFHQVVKTQSSPETKPPPPVSPELIVPPPPPPPPATTSNELANKPKQLKIQRNSQPGAKGNTNSLDPREELMLAIKNFGGPQNLRKAKGY